jgi:hypothetical protein
MVTFKSLDSIGKVRRFKAVHSKRKTGISGVWTVVIVVVAIIILISIAAWYASQYKPPTLEVSAVSLNPGEINTNSSAMFSFTIKNNDADKPHTVDVVFNTTSPVLFYQNNVQLTKDNGFQNLTIILQSSQQSTYPLKVNGTLGPGASTSTYSIRVQFYNENSTLFDTETIGLKVDQT